MSFLEGGEAASEFSSKPHPVWSSYVMCILKYIQSISISRIIQINYVMIKSHTGYFVLKKMSRVFANS